MDVRFIIFYQVNDARGTVNNWHYSKPTNKLNVGRGNLHIQQSTICITNKYSKK